MTGPTRRSLLCAAAALPLASCAAETASVSPPPILPHLLLTAFDGDASAPAQLDAWRASVPPGVAVTVGYGPRLSALLGLADFTDAPAFPGDRLDPARCGGDVVVELRGADPGVLAAAAEAVPLAPRWRQRGFLRVPADGSTPRNLFGFKDGTANPAPEQVLTPGGGTFMVVRRIRMDADGFLALPQAAREAVIGRYRDSGAPLGASGEFDEVALLAKRPDGSYVIPAGAHVRLAHPRLDRGARMLRRGYSYDDGPGDRGLVFVAFMADPALFTRVQRRLSSADALNAFTRHTGGTVCYVPPA
ncbi:Dyp-type peroxidase [Actinorhabdospora filicis]|uniref:Dyp-type peroxidase n=1 Tax=Actinorhabdospora filicis TaxID=1785913 RepID=UPI0025561F5F|nr:Dyp-type peroxidase [Actinorhabdospora filicis]